MRELLVECNDYMKNTVTNDVAEFNEFRRSVGLGPLEAPITLYKIFVIRATLLDNWSKGYQHDEIESVRRGGRKIKSNKANKHKKSRKSRKTKSRRH